MPLVPLSTHFQSLAELPTSKLGPSVADLPGVCPDWESNQLPFGSQAHAQSIELYQPGISLIFIYSIKGLNCGQTYYRHPSIF